MTDHLAGNAADKLGAQLPGALHDIIREVPAEDRDQGQRFKLTEFYQRVADKLNVDAATSERYSQQFMSLLKAMVTEGELHKVQITLSDDYAPLFASTSATN